MSDFFKFSLIRVGFEPQLERRRALRRAELMKQTGLVFVHVPRTAGSSVSHSLYGQFIGHFPVTALEAVSEREVLVLPRFALIRNPWERLASAYRFAIAGGGDGPQAARVAPHVGRQILKIGSFERFVKEWLPGHVGSKLDGLFRTQSYYLCNAAGEMPFDHLGRVEDLRETEQWLSDTLGRQIALPRTNFTQTDDGGTRFDSEMIDIAAKIYASDIARLKY